MTDRLVLGTAQLGMAYGINNRAGKPDFDKACDIVKTAIDYGISRFDTAQAYGESEAVLGRVFDRFKLGGKVKIYSKLPPQLDCCSRQAVHQAVEDSLKKLNVTHLEGLFLHREEQLSYWEAGLGKIMQDLISDGKVRAAGASFYTPARALAALELDGIRLTQVPANILDRRFEEAGVFKKAGERGKTVFVRSIFLQGLLVMPLERVPASMQHALPFLERLEVMSRDMRTSRWELAVGYAARQWPDSFILFGAEDRRQVLDNVKVFNTMGEVKFDKSIFNHVPDSVLNPVLWPKL